MFKAFLKDIPFGLSILLFAIAVGLILIIAPIGGKKALIVRSGSMQPAIGVGDLITVKLQTNYKAGDVVAFKDPAKSSVTVTHRILNEKIQEGKVFYQTKGDANEEADFTLVPKENVIGRADHSIRAIGKVFAQVKTKNGFLMAVIFPAAFVILLELINIAREIRKIKNPTPKIIYHQALRHLYHHYSRPMGVPHPSASFKSLTQMLLGKKATGSDPAQSSYHTGSDPVKRRGLGFRAILPIVVTFLLAGNTFSFYSDTETSINNTFSAAESFGPEPGDVVINELMWMGSTKGASDEWIELRNTTGSTIDISGWQVTKWVTSGTDHEELMLTVPGSSSIPANGFFLIAQFPSGDPGSALNVGPNVTTPSVVLNNTDLQIRLFVSNWDSGGTLIDTAGNKSAPLKGEHQTGQPKKFYSMERNATPSDGTIASSWHTATASIGFDSGEDVENRGTPKSTNSAP